MWGEESLPDTRVTDEDQATSSISALCQALSDPRCHLRELRMEGCSLTGFCCAYLASVLVTNTSLAELSLSGNKLGESGVRVLCEGLKHPLCTLRTLRLAHTNLTDDVTRPLCSALRGSQSLQELDLLGNNFTERSAASFHALKKSVPKIKTQILPTRCQVVERYSDDTYCYRAKFNGPGTFSCEKTGLCFEVTKAGTIEYKLLPWSDNLAQCEVRGLQMAGSLFDVTAQPGLVQAIYLPHFVCLRGGDEDEPKLQIVHFGANGEMTLEAPSELQAFHVVLRNSELFACSVVSRFIPSMQRKFLVYAQALLYRPISNADITLHLYLILDEAHREKTLERYTRGKQKIVKPFLTKPVYFSCLCVVESQPHSELNPKKLLFDGRHTGVNPNFCEIPTKSLETMDVGISLKDDVSRELVWRVTVRPGDIDSKFSKKQRPPGMVTQPGWDDVPPESLKREGKKNSGMVTQRGQDDVPPKSLKMEEKNSETFIKKHRLSLIERMGNIKPLMDILKYKRVLQDVEVEEVLAETTSNSKNSRLIQMVLKKGTESQEEFLRALQDTDPFFIL